MRDKRGTHIHFLGLLLFAPVIGCNVYAVCYYIGHQDLAQFFNSIIFSMTALMGMIGVFKWNRIVNDATFSLFFYCIAWMFLSGLIQVAPLAVLPSALRFTSYIASAYLGFFFLKRYGESRFNEYVGPFIKWCIILSFLWVIIEVALRDIDYLNGAYRLAGSFKKHQLGLALFAYCLLIIYTCLTRERSLKKLIVSGLLFCILIATQSRALLGLALLVLAFYFIVRVKSVFKLIALSFALFGFAFASYYVILNTDILPRYKTALVNDTGMYDASTLERIEITENSLANIHGLNKIVGIGMGGFQNFYKSISRRDEVAAHNNYLLFYIEGGYVALCLYVLFQIKMSLKLIRYVRSKNSAVGTTTFFLFFGISIGSFLLNNYYFYCSEILVWCYIGAFLALDSKKVNRNEHISLATKQLPS